MYADPQSVTVNAVAVSLPRTGSSLSEGTFKSADSTVNMVITHRSTSKGRLQHRVQLRKDVVVPSIYNPAQSAPQSYSVAIVIDNPSVGVATIDIAYIARALVAWASNANLDKLLSSES